jgi:hypothetical protein
MKYFTDERPQHKVRITIRITKPFYLGVTEVTQGQWESIMETRPWERVGVVRGGLLREFADGRPAGPLRGALAPGEPGRGLVLYRLVLPLVPERSPERGQADTKQHCTGNQADPHVLVTWVNQIRQLTAPPPAAPDPHVLVTWVNQIRQLTGPPPAAPDPHVLVTWVNQIRQLKPGRRPVPWTPTSSPRGRPGFGAAGGTAGVSWRI